MDNLPISHTSFAGRKQNGSCLKDGLRADLMRRTQGACVVESLCVEGKTEGSFDAGTECLSVTYTGNTMGDSTKSKEREILTKSEDAGIVDFSLDECSRVKVTGTIASS